MNYKEVIESKYNREAWQKLLYDIFRNKISFWNTPSAVHVSSRLAKEALNLGKISLVDGESIAIYEVELSDKVDIERNRRGIRDMLTTDWRNMGYAGAFMFCYRKDESILRFSYAVKPGQIVGVRERSKSLEVIANSLAGFNHSKYPWLEWDESIKAGKYLHTPERADIPENIKEHLIVELYSK